jgi:hypothetical protein
MRFDRLDSCYWFLDGSRSRRHARFRSLRFGRINGQPLEAIHAEIVSDSIGIHQRKTDGGAAMMLATIGYVIA